VIQKYGTDFRADDEGAIGLMLALYHGQNELVPGLIKLGVFFVTTGQQNKIGVHYLLSGFLQNNLQRKPQTGTRSTLARFCGWSIRIVCHEIYNMQFLTNSHSIVYF